MTRDRSVALLTALALAGAVALGGPAAAAAETRVDAKADWSVFKASSGSRECWIVSAPTSSVAKRGGKDVTREVSRGDVLLMISVRPAEQVRNEVSFNGGYPFRAKSTVSLKVGAATFQLFTDGEWSWTSSPEEDGKVVEALRKGSVATLVGVSQRGTETTDTFSLKGFSAALEAAQDLCR